MGSIVNRIQSMGIEVVCISTGCPYLCQPIDVGINKPIKCRLQNKWGEWMMEGGEIINGKAKNNNKMVADWLMEVYSNMPVEIGKNSWKSAGFEWF